MFSLEKWPLSINKKYFWKASKIPMSFLVSTTTLALCGFILIENTKIAMPLPNYQIKVTTSKLIAEAYKKIREERQKSQPTINTSTDPQGIGLIGTDSSVLTSKDGNLSSKQTSINPNWGAVFIDMFNEAKLKPGDPVAVGMSGSFPALNISFWIAAENYGLKPIIVSSLGSSSFGANIPGFSWLEIEGILFRAGFIRNRSTAVTIGAKNDLGHNLPPGGISAAKNIIAKEGIPLLAGSTKAELIQARLDLFQRQPASPIKAYINIGGGIASVGTAKIKNSFKAGVIIPESSARTHTENELEQGVMTFFKSENIPILHIINVQRLAKKYQLPIAPKKTPEIGQGLLYFSYQYYGPLLLSFLVALFGLLIWQAKQVRKLLKAAT